MYNKGTGPAIIHYAQVSHAGKPVQRWAELPAFNDITQSHIGNVTIPANTSVTPLRYQGKQLEQVLEVDASTRISLCYCSIYDECWLVDRSNRAQPVNTCRTGNETYFLQ
ncbi:hypothetical protein L1F30_02310 [Simiduia sp. 21SJ11W-1]|uniref:hypothetical protein n=1 Tax=Simiduia sp. 21SJ11W-1 TaxID=2909669 RepID=UPI00209FDA34|nr:hypothetical protein [Simiduia sp. 21SJ11W-1]UTA48389.1 hypothetical protein L1F30_02310 [Simiduia sp. 21SJ11W-1]